ncbi:MAG: NAD kinase [Flavobacteriaceae bacterium]|nr:NAD kinase [Flavobacteriaceae bacterium]MDH3795294.1 NAD kinase [Flavobacteriaceae bacterium]
MKVAIYGQQYPQEAGSYIMELLHELDKNQIQIAVEHSFLETLQDNENCKEYAVYTHSEGLDATFDLFISIGGDGTILRAVTYIGDLGIPIVGVNTGRLGFLSIIKRNEVKDLVREFISGNYTLVERSLVELRTDFDIPEFEGRYYALNEVTVSRKDTTSMITVETHLDDEYLTSYWSDGLIIATPTGSTGYSLSCGGPVLMPSVRSLVITPIAPHNLNARPLVISDDTQIRLKVSGREDFHLVSLDSRVATFKSGQEILIAKANFVIKMVAFPKKSFFKTIRNKLLWGQDRRN